MNTPTAPSPLCLSPVLIPVAIAKQMITCEYVIFTRCIFCYNYSFSLKSNMDKWELILNDNKTKYIIPRNKTLNDFRLTCLSLGLPNKDKFKVEVHSKEKINNIRYFNRLGEILKFITANEILVGDVAYGTL